MRGAVLYAPRDEEKRGYIKRIEMKLIAATIMSLFMLVSISAHAQAVSPSGSSQSEPAHSSQTIKITRSGSLQAKKGSAEYFTGSVQVQELFPATDPSRTSGGKVTFEPGAECMAYTPARSNLDRDGRDGLDSAVGRTNRGDSKRGCHLDSSGGETLARRNTKHGDDAHCNTGTAQWQSRGVDGEGHRRAIP